MLTYDLRRQMQMATVFVQRLVGLPQDVRRAIVCPDYQDDYYVQATLQVRTLMKKAFLGTAGLTEQLEAFASGAECELERAGIIGDLGTIAAEAVRAMLVSPLGNAEPWVSSVYQPFEILLPRRDLMHRADEELAS